MTPGGVDLNGDVGEGMASDERLIPLLTSVNIACGGHTGDETSMLLALRRARAAGVAIGAHPSFPDRESFGRRELSARPADVRSWVVEQVSLLKRYAAQIGASLAHVKPHGALYNQAARDSQLADAIVDAVDEVDPRLTLFALAQSALTKAAERRGLRVAAEGFVDRAYHSNGTLAPRSFAGAVLADQAAIIAQAVSLARGEPVQTLDASQVRVRIDTLCLHGDRPDVVVLAMRIRERFAAEGIKLRPVDSRHSVGQQSEG